MTLSLPIDWDDIAVEHRVDEAIAAGHVLPRWGWPAPRPYNGVTGKLRILAWQKIQIACRNGWMPWPSQCSVCGRGDKLHHHTENYLRPIFSLSICMSCHFRLHRRFQSSVAWLQFLEGVHPQSWIQSIASRELILPETEFLARKDNPIDASQLP